jgi:micrococcal nuclease
LTIYEYRARIVRVVDGDTVHAEVDLGCDVHVALTLRLAEINAPELATADGKASKAWLENQLALTSGLVTLRTEKDHREKYGRYLARIYSGEPGLSGVSVNDLMIAARMAVPYDGGKR